MALYFLEYDLRKQRNYQRLYEELESFGAKRILESLWCFNIFNTDTTKLRDYFKSFIDADDGLIVIECSSWAKFNTLATPKNLA
jgi:hypothetical protein